MYLSFVSCAGQGAGGPGADYAAQSPSGRSPRRDEAPRDDRGYDAYANQRPGWEQDQGRGGYDRSPPQGQGGYDDRGYGPQVKYVYEVKCRHLCRHKLISS